MSTSPPPHNSAPKKIRNAVVAAICVIIGALGTYVANKISGKETGKVSNGIQQIAKDSAKQTNTNNQPNQTNNNKGDVNNDNSTGDKVKGDKVAGDKVHGDKIDNRKRYDKGSTDNSTNAPVTRGGDTSITVSGPLPRHLNNEEKQMLIQFTTIKPLTLVFEDKPETIDFATEVYNYLLATGHKIGERDQAGLATADNWYKGIRFGMSFDSIIVIRNQ